MDLDTWHTIDPLNCPAVRALNSVSGKWKPAILYFLSLKTMRFGELQRAIPSISHKTLTQQLRELGEDGILHRRAFATIPPRTEYSLTGRGRRLGPILEMLFSWGGEEEAEGSAAARAG